MIVLDTSFLVAHTNPLDVHHPRANAGMKELAGGMLGPILLPEYVFMESMTVVGSRCDLATAVKLGIGLLEAREVEFVPCADHLAAAFEIFRAQPKFVLSFADASIVAIARARKASFVATFDRALVEASRIPGFPA